MLLLISNQRTDFENKKKSNSASIHKNKLVFVMLVFYNLFIIRETPPVAGENILTISVLAMHTGLVTSLILGKPLQHVVGRGA